MAVFSIMTGLESAQPSGLQAETKACNGEEGNSSTKLEFDSSVAPSCTTGREELSEIQNG